jgi:FlaG/FlaF family flagellin (archaellin)
MLCYRWFTILLTLQWHDDGMSTLVVACWLLVAFAVLLPSTIACLLAESVVEVYNSPLAGYGTNQAACL